MVFTVSVRDVGALEKMLKETGSVSLPKECEHNSNVFYEILKYAERVLPRFSSLSEKEVRTIADTVAYLIRTDLIKRGVAAFGCMPLPDDFLPNMFGEDGITAHLLNDPAVLSPEWDMPNSREYVSRGAELFRCYCTALKMIDLIKDKLGEPTFGDAFALADMTSFLLDPRDLTDYKYTSKEISRFQETLDREWKEI